MRKWILPALMGLGFLLGLGITLYPAVSNYLLEKNQSTAMQGYIEEQEKVPDEVSERLKQEAREYNEKLREGTVVLTDPFDPEALKYITDEYEEMLNPDGDGLMAIWRSHPSKYICLFTMEPVMVCCRPELAIWATPRFLWVARTRMRYCQDTRGFPMPVF